MIALLYICKIMSLPEDTFGLQILSLPAFVCLCACTSECPCVNNELVSTITHHPFKLGSTNLEQRCKTPRLRSLLFWGLIDIDLDGQI